LGLHIHRDFVQPHVHFIKAHLHGVFLLANFLLWFLGDALFWFFGEALFCFLGDALLDVFFPGINKL
tara:strand:- start:897 stop:1097 length:201 start_codon:yes stop_codon:yes gene_type:complete